MKKLVLACLTTFVLTSCFKQTPPLQSEVLPEVSANTVGMSGERLDRVDSMLTHAVLENKISGSVALITRHGMADNTSKSDMQLDYILLKSCLECLSMNF